MRQIPRLGLNRTVLGALLLMPLPILAFVDPATLGVYGGVVVAPLVIVFNQRDKEE